MVDLAFEVQNWSAAVVSQKRPLYNAGSTDELIGLLCPLLKKKLS